MAVINKARLAQYLSNDYNVLMIGLHGIGKTETIKQLFTERFDNRWRYFSASTLDPWVDFVGIPKPVETEDGTYLDLIRPKFIQNDEIEAIFFDEFNRAPDKVINAVMELIQFKSINGHKLNNLKVIWAAINPEDEVDTYSVNHLDPAQLDRFHVHYQVPYEIDVDYFNNKYPSNGKIFVDWWNSLPVDVKKSISPRRVDYIVDAYNKGCRIEDFIQPNTKINLKELRSLLKKAPIIDQIKNIKTDDEAKVFLDDVNNSTKLLDLVKNNEQTSVEFTKKYWNFISKDLLEVFASSIYANTNGGSNISNIKELAEYFVDKKSSHIMSNASIINSVNLNLIYSHGGNLDNDIIALKTTDKSLLNKLTEVCLEILIKGNIQSLNTILYGPNGRTNPEDTTFFKMIHSINKHSFISNQQRRFINNRLYSGNLSAQNFL